MNREDFFDRLNARLDERVDPAADDVLREAAASDAELDQLLQAQRGLWAELARPVRPSTSLADRILAEMNAGDELDTESLAEVAPRRGGMSWQVMLVCGGVAALAAAVLLAVLVNQPNPQDVGPQVVDNNPVPDGAAPALPEESLDDVPLRELLERAGEHSYALANDTQASLADLSLLWPGSSNNSEASPSAADESWPGETLLEGVRTRLAPPSTSVEGVWDLLLPRSDEETTS